MVGSTDLVAAGQQVVAQLFDDAGRLLWLDWVFVQRHDYRLRRLHAVYTDLAELCPYHAVRARQVDISVTGESHARRRQNVLVLKALDELCQFVFADLKQIY